MAQELADIKVFQLEEDFVVQFGACKLMEHKSVVKSEEIEIFDTLQKYRAIWSTLQEILLFQKSLGLWAKNKQQKWQFFDDHNL